MGNLERNYWNKRYLRGENSGIGSVGNYREWRWHIIDKHVEPLDDIVDVGCGDLSFWEGRSCKQYTGIDVSEVIVQRNRLRRPHWAFICGDASEYFEGLRADVVLCLAVLFHIKNECDYVEIIKNLCRYSRKWIIINTWMKQPQSFDRSYQFYRRFEHYFEVFFRHGFAFHSAAPCFDGLNAIYIFKSVEADSND